MKTRFSLLLLAALLLPRMVEAQTPGANVILVGDTTNMLLMSGNTRLPCMYLPSSYTQQLVQNDELNGAAMITGIDFYCGSPSSTGCPPGCTIYLANTYVPNMGGGMVGFGPMFQQVAVDSLVCTTGWNHYEFDTAFFYNGLGNLIVAIDCPWGWDGGNFYVSQRGFHESRYVSTRLANITPSTTTSASPCRNIMRLHTQPVPSPVATCPAPTLWVDSAGATAMKMRWSPGYQDTSWTVECITDGDTAWHTSGLVWGDTSYTMTGLTPGSDYTFRLTAYCTDTFATVLKHVLTNCTPVALPYAEGLDSSWYIPDCWYVASGTEGNKPEVSSRYCHSGLQAVRLNGGAVVLPDFDAAPDSLELYFWAKSGGGSIRSLYVGMVTDPLDLSSFVPLDTVVMPNYANWVAAAVRTNRYSRPSGRLAIVTADPLNTWMYIDDIEVSHIVPCEALAPATLDWKSDTAALVRWNDTVGAVYYDVAYGSAGFVPDSTTIVTDVRTDSLLLTGLLPYTQYDVYVRPECGSFTTHWSPVMTFRTFCSALGAVPWVEDFDSYTGYPLASELPCWRGHVGANTVVVDHAGGSHSGLRALRWSNAENDQYAILPAIDTSAVALRSVQLSFWAYDASASYSYYNPTHLIVGVMNDPEVDSTFTPVDSVVISFADWHRYDFSFGSYTGTGSYIALKCNPGPRSIAYIDDISIDLVPPCPSVTGMTVRGLTATSVTVGWDPAMGLTGADSGTVWLTYIDSVETATPVAATAGVAVPEYTFGGLTAGTTYYVWVRAICPKGDTSDWEGPMEVVPGVWNMRANRNDTLTMCGVSLYDDGGIDADFSAQHSSLVILPDMAGHLVSVGGLCNVGGISALTVYDGVGTSGAVLWTKTYNNSNAVSFGPVVSDSGPLTLVFDGSTAFSTYYEGFNLQVSCVPDSCIVHRLRLDPAVPPSDTALALTWQAGGASHYEVEYGPVGFAPGSGTMVGTATNHFTIGGLSSLDRREVRVRSVCGVSDTGDWVSGIFTTQTCSDAVYRENFDSTLYAGSTCNMPIGFNGYPYSYVQTLVDSAHLAGLEGGITALAFQPVDNVAGDHQSRVTVYLANVADTAITAGPILPDAGHRFVKVVDSANFCHDATTDWQLFHFDHPFMWDGHQNLLVAVLRQDGGGGMRTEYAGHYRYTDLLNNIYRGYLFTGFDPIDIDSVESYNGGYGTWHLGDLRLYTNTCALPLCAVPVVDSVVTDYESATVSWHGSGGEYQIAITPGYAPLIPVNGNSYTFTGLQPSTTYQVTLRQNCTADSLGYSDGVTVEFTTDSFACPQPDSLRVYEITHNAATFDWLFADDESPWQLEVWTPGVRHVSLAPTGHPFTVEGLAPGTEYCAYVHGYCGSEHQIAGAWSDTVCFATLACPVVTGLDTASVAANSVTLTWDAVEEGQDWLVQYGPAGFVPTEGADSVVPGAGCVVVGLTPATAYDFYVRTRCADDWLAGEYAVLRNVVTRQSVGIESTEDNTTFSAVLVPNPATGMTTLHLSGLPKSYRGAVSVAVSDLTGREVLSRTISCRNDCRLALDVSELPQGAYFVRVVCGRNSTVRKLIIK